VWIAKGSYRPDETSFDPAGTGDRAATFNLMDGVAIYGHFAGTETELSERDLENPANETILSGDLNDNDIFTPGNPPTFTN
jgi:hypothetical protein